MWSRSEFYDRTNTFTLVHQIKGFVNAVLGERVGNHRIDLDLAAQIFLDVTWQL